MIRTTGPLVPDLGPSPSLLHNWLPRLQSNLAKAILSTHHAIRSPPTSARDFQSTTNSPNRLRAPTGGKLRKVGTSPLTGA